MSVWMLYDDEVSQYIREFPDKWEMIMYVWLDTTEQDREEGYPEYVVVHGWLYKSDITQDDIEYVCESYGYDPESLDELMVAADILEEQICCDEYVVYETDDKKDAEESSKLPIFIGIGAGVVVIAVAAIIVAKKKK